MNITFIANIFSVVFHLMVVPDTHEKYITISVYRSNISIYAFSMGSEVCVHRGRMSDRVKLKAGVIEYLRLEKVLTF